MRIRILTFGKVKQGFVLEGEAEYLKRLKSWVNVDFEEIECQAGKESAVLISKIKDKELLIVLDEAGTNFSSNKFANYLQKEMTAGSSSIVFAIGGAYGWDDSARGEADLILSLSPMTFTYQMSRLILIEQIYRAMSIIKGQPYHK